MPSFAIEVPGEANPLDETSILQTLERAASTNPNQIQSGTKQLQQWEKTPGFYKHLQSAYLHKDVSVEVRYLAIIQLKNGIDKYWRKTAENAVSKEDKQAIRDRLLQSCLEENDDRLALQNAIVIAKVARFEYPKEWPDLLSILTKTLQSAAHAPPLHVARTLLVLLHVIKSFSTVRLQRTRQDLQAVTPEIVRALATLYADTIGYWQPRYASGDRIDPEVSRAMHISLLAIRTLRRLLVTGYDNPNREADVISVWNFTQQNLANLLNLEKPPESDRILDKNMIQLAKLHYNLAKEYPAAFALLPNAVQVVHAYWNLAKEFGSTFCPREVINTSGNQNASRSDENSSSAEKLALIGLLIIRNCVKFAHGHNRQTRLRPQETKEELEEAKRIIKEQLLTSQFIQEVMETTVTRYFVFRPIDLLEWEDEPEEWEKRGEGEGDDWEFSVRSCSEKLFLDLAINYKDILEQPLLQVFYSVATPSNEDVLFKDSVYTAIGLAAPVLHEKLDIDAFVRDVLVAEVQKQKPGYNIVRRRAAILLGQWAPVKLNERRLSYDVFQHLLNKDDSLNDLVVRITAGRQMSCMADSWEFVVKDFLPYAETILTRLMLLMDEVETTETKMALLNTLSVIVERLDHHILPFAERIVSLLPPLWEASGDEHLMKQAILAMLTRLVNSMKASSAPLHNLSYPIIKGAIEPGSETQVYLFDDAMDLWASVLIQTVAPASAEALELFPYLYPIYELGSESLCKALEITESYAILAPQHILSAEVRTPLFKSLAELLGTLRPEANGLVCNVVEMIVRAAEAIGGEAGVSQTAADLVHTGFFGKLLHGLRGSYIAHCTTGPNAQGTLVEGIVETDYYSILARLILGSPMGFCQACEAVASETSGQPATLDTTMKWLLEEWFSHFSNIGDPLRRKLMCLALTRLLETKQPFILVNLQSLMTVWTDVVTELRESEEDTTGDSLVYARAGEDVLAGPDSPENDRRRELTNSDILSTVKVPAFIKHHLGEVISTTGEAFQTEWLANVDKDVIAAFTALNIM